MVLRLKLMGKLITFDNYLSVRLEPRSCMVLGLKPMGKLTTLDKYLSVRQNQSLAWSSDSSLWEN